MEGRSLLLIPATILPPAERSETCFLGHKSTVFFYLQQMAAAAQREDVLDALKQENDALKQEIEALKQEKQEFRIHASYYNTARLQVPHDVWVRMTVLHTLNTIGPG